jgi:hypothetical protein
MKNVFHILIFVLISFLHLSQSDYSENLWLSSQIGTKINEKTELSCDFGWRTYENFIQKRRTILGRIIVEKIVQNKNYFGIGYAQFEHFSDDQNREAEVRPFVQYRRKYESDKYNFHVRLRNEFRYFTIKDTWFNRSRIQIQFERRLWNDKLKPTLSFEGFLTPKKKTLFESRYTLGVNVKISKNISNYIFYTLQRQSNYQGNQHIIGTQLQVKIK